MTVTAEHKTTNRRNPWAPAILCMGLLMGTNLMGQAGLLKPVREADGGAHENGYYNQSDSQYSGGTAIGTGGMRVNFSGLTPNVAHSVLFKVNGGAWQYASVLHLNGNISAGGAIITTGAAESTAEIEITQTELLAAPYNLGDQDLIRFSIDDNGTSTTPDAEATITGGGNDLTYDIAVPTILSVTSSTGDGRKKIGTVINITVTFSEAATLSSGVLRTTLNTGALVDVAAATYNTTAVGTYTVQEGDEVGVLNNTNIINTTGSITDAAGNTLTSYTPAADLSASSNLDIDGVRPFISSVTSIDSDGSYGIGAVINFTVTFSEATTVSGGNLRVTFETGDVDRNVDIAGATYNTTTSSTYTVQVDDVSADLATESISITAGTILDVAGNALTNFTPASLLSSTSSLVVDGIKPTIQTVTSSTPNGTYGIGDNIAVSLNFSETVSVAGGNLEVTLETGDTDQIAYVTPFSNSSSGTGTYTVVVGDVTGDLTVSSITDPLNALTDVAGNTMDDFTIQSSNLAASKAIVIDGVRPTVTNVTSLSANDNYGIGDAISIQVTMSEAVTLTPGQDLEVTLANGNGGTVADISPITSSSTAVGNYVVAEGDVSADLDAAFLGLSGGTLEDAGGNNIVDFTIPPGQNISDSKAIVVDGVRPTISGARSTDLDATYAIGDNINITLDFTEPVTTAGGGSIVILLETGAVDTQITISGVVSSTSASGTYTVLDGHESSDLTITSVSMSTGTLEDDFGNAMTDFAIPPATNLDDVSAIVVDGIRPVVSSVSASTPNGSYKVGEIIDITVTFDDAVDRIGTPTLNLDVGGGYLVDYTSGTGTAVLTFQYTVQAGDSSSDLAYVDASALLVGTSIKDASGNDAVVTLPTPGAANSLSANKALIIDTQAPTVLNVTSLKADGYYKAGVTIPIAVVLSEPVTVTGTPQLTLALGAGYAVDHASTSGDTLFFDYVVQPGHTSSDLAYQATNSLTLNGGTILDAADNPAALNLPTLGDPASLNGAKALVIDTTAPTVLSVSSTALNGYYVETDLIPITITFSEAVYKAGGGTPTLILETGATDAVVDYVSGSGTTDLLFNYTVGLGHESGNLDYTGTTALVLNLATIRDAAGNDAVLTLAAPGASGSLGFSKDRDVDAIIPTVTAVTSNKADGIYKAGVGIPISVVFSEAVAVAGGVPTLTLNVDGGYAVDYTSVSGDTLVFEYMVQAGQNQVDLDYLSTAALSAGVSTIRDVAGNDADVALASPGSANSLGGSKNIDVDTTPPTVSNVTSTTSNAAYKAGQSIDVRVTFSEVVIDAGSPYVILETGTTDRNATYVSGKGTTTLVFSYTVVAGDSSNDLDYVSTSSLVAGTAVQDSAGNQVSATPLPAPGAAGSLGANKAIIIDTKAPTVLNVTSSKTDGYYKAGETIPITVIFSETVTVSGTPTLTLETGTTDRDATYSSGSGTATLTFSYTVQSGDVSSDLDYADASALSAGTSIQDAAGNDATLTLAAPGNSNSLGDNKALVIDTTPPTVTSVSSTAADGYYVAGDTISITVTLTETVYKAGAGSLTLTLETGSTDAVLDYVSGSGTDTLTFIYIVALGHESDNLDYIDANALQLNLTTIRDTTENNADLTLAAPGASGSLGFGKDRNIDAIIPTVTAVTSTKADGVYKAGEVIPICVVFSEAVAVTGTPTLSLDVSGGYDVDYVIGSGTDTLVFEYTIQAGHNEVDLSYESTSALNLNGGSIQDAATNPADTTLPAPTGAGSLSGTKDLIIDTEAPAVSQVTSSTTSGRYGVGDTLAISIVFSEAVIVTGGQPKLTLETDVNDTEASYTSGSGSNTLIFNYIVQAGDSSDDLGYVDTTSLSFNGAVIADAGDNVARIILPVPGGAGSLAANKDFVIDTHAPEVMSVSSTTTDGWYKAGVVIPIRVVFSERVTVSGTPTLTLDVVDGYAVNYTSGSGNAALVFNYTVRDSDDCADLDYQSSASLSLNGGVINDLGRNDADLSLPPPGADSSLGGTKDLIIDTQAPSALAAVVYDGAGADIDSTSSSDSLTAYWTGFSEPVSGIALYEYAIGTTRDSSDVVDWTSNGLDTLVTVKGLSLAYKDTFYLSVRATDGAGNVSDTVSSDGVRIVDRPRLTMSVVQNSVISEYVQIFVNDTLAMADSISIVMDGLPVSVTEIKTSTYAYVGTHKLVGDTTHTLEVTGFSGWGDTTRTSSLAMALAKQGQPWVATSIDQRFTTAGSPGSVSSDRYLLVVDSTLMGLSAVPGGAYRLGDGQFTFDQPVRVSMHRGVSSAGQEEAQAIYVLRSNDRWEELPSVDEGELVTTWTNRAGSFRLGRRTIIVPQITSLHQNYPNPFNPTTRIAFDLGFQDGPRQHARVVIYNLLGQEVLTLYDGETSTGRYELTWQGVDARGLAAASGVYFVRLSTNTGHQMTRKMLLVR